MNDHFDKIFWYIVGITVAAFTYVFVITFISIKETNLRFADTALGFILGTVLGSAISYLLGGSPAQIKKSSPSGTTTAEVTANITTTPDSTSRDNTTTNEPT